MNSDFRKFLIIIIGVVSAMILGGWIVFGFLIPQYYIKVLPYLVLFFVVISLVVHRYQLYLIEKDLGKFTRSNMILTFIKLFLYSVFAIAYLAGNSKQAIPFVICLMLLYAVFSFIEVAEITRIIRRKQ